jgi:hypothetical protein
MSKGDLKGAVQFPAKGAQTTSREAGLSELVQMARQAFEERRRKQSLVLATAILKIDPENREALVIQSWVSEDLKKDLDNAAIQVEEARRENALGLWDRAERLVRGTLAVDPDNEEAKKLLAEVIPAQRALAEVRPPEDIAYSPMVPNPRASVKRRVVASIGIAAVVVAVLVFALRKPGGNDKSNAEQTQEDDNSVLANAIALGDDPNAVNEISVASLEFFVVPQRGVQLSVDNAPAQPVPQKLELPPGPHRLVFTSEGYAPEVVSETLIAGTNRVLPVVMKSITPEVLPSIVGGGKRDSGPVAAKPIPPVSNVIPEPSPDRPVAAPPTAEAKGSLAISAAVPVAVYLAGKELGTTPITIELPPGLQTLEYRYENQSKTASYIFRSNETTATTIVFEVNLRINARPWAQVSIEGPQGKTLGQTPLSNITVAAGSVLVFQNPNFPEKKHRVTGTDSTILLSFP